MSNDSARRPQRVVFRPERVNVSAKTKRVDCPEFAVDTDGMKVMCAFESGHACPHRFIRIDPTPLSICGKCGEEFKIDKSDPHWSTGRGPLCPKRKRKP